MQVPAYRIHNVLKDYSRQLIRKRISEQIYGAAVNRSGISDAKRQAVIEKISENISREIGETESEGKQRLARPYREIEIAEDHKETLFFYNVIDKDRRKKTCSISIEDPVFLMKKFDAL